MRIKTTIGGFFCALFLMTAAVGQVSAGEDSRETTGRAAGEELSLYATAAVLMDADSGRVLYGKNQDTPLAMASTTKIMTCILALEQTEDLDEEVTVSAYAAGMPKVKLYLKKGERYPIRDLLFSLMLESHNDSAVAVAEHIGKRYLPKELRNKDTAEFTAEESKLAVAAFADLMNAKAEELGCTQTYFITPNGLDATETITLENGETITKEHCTTAAELARILSYCIGESSKQDLFLEITGAKEYAFSQNGRNFSCVNHNAFLNMMDGALSGKTGFTNKAGYCYVGSLRRDERTYVVALLGCGWPNHKTYKWSDTRELMEYGLDHYAYREFLPEVTLQAVEIKNGASKDGDPYGKVNVAVKGEGLKERIQLLTAEGEEVVARTEQKKECRAPVRKGDVVGKVSIFLKQESGEERLLKEIPLCLTEDVEAKDFPYMVRYLWNVYLPGA